MRAEILSIGTELLMGELVDTNSAFLSAELAKLGIETQWVTKVGDDPERLREAIARACQRSDVALTSGGLGPTSDDLTRETIADVFGEETSVQDDLLAHLRDQFADRGFPMPETNVKQATLIPSARALPNPHGTAPGWWAERDGACVVAMPGPPREMQAMWANEVAPRLRERNAGVAIATRNLKTYGISEGGLDEMLSPLFESENPRLGIYSKQDGIHLRAIATAGTDADATALLYPMELEIRRIVGDGAIWGVDDETPESKAVDALRGRGLTLAVADCFTGGALTSRLSDADSGGDALRGSLVAPMGALAALGFDAGAGADGDDGGGADTGDDDDGGAGDAAARLAEFARERLGADVGLAMVGLDFGGWQAGFAARGKAAAAVSWRSSGMSMRMLRGGNRQRTLGRATTHALLELGRYLA